MDKDNWICKKNNIVHGVWAVGSTKASKLLLSVGIKAEGLVDLVDGNYYFRFFKIFAIYYGPILNLAAILCY